MGWDQKEPRRTKRRLQWGKSESTRHFWRRPKSARSSLSCAQRDVGRLPGGTLICVAVSYCYCKRLPPPQRLETTQIYSFTVLEVRSRKWVLWNENQEVGWARGSRREFVSCLFSMLQSLQSLLFSFFFFWGHSVPLIRTHYIQCPYGWSRQFPHLKVLNLHPSAENLLP